MAIFNMVYGSSSTPTPSYKTFTIQYEEKEDMTSGWTYSDDAAGLTAGSTEFDKFFGYYGCRLSKLGLETAKITQEGSGGYGNLAITGLGTLTSGDHVMIAFPRRGIKKTKNGSIVTLSITDDPDKEGYQYLNFQRGGITVDKFYIGAYFGSMVNGYIVSLSGQTPYVNVTPSSLRSSCHSNGERFLMATALAYDYIRLLYIMKYGNPNSQDTIGLGYIGGNSTFTSTGGTNGVQTATYGESTGTSQMKIFGIEDFVGNASCFLDGSCGKYINISNVYDNINNTSNLTETYGWIDTGLTRSLSASLKSIVSDNRIMIYPNYVTGQQFTTYYHSSIYIETGTDRILKSRAYYDTNNNYVGVLHIECGFNTARESTTGCRLMYI